MKISQVKAQLKKLKTIIPFKDSETDINLAPNPVVYDSIKDDTIIIHTTIDGFKISVQKTVKE